MKKGPPGGFPGGPIKSAITYFPAWQYHRQSGLNYCVRDGNRCLPTLLVTDKSGAGPSPHDGNCHVAFVAITLHCRQGIIKNDLTSLSSCRTRDGVR